MKCGFLSLFLPALLFSCSGSGPDETRGLSGSTPVVYVTNYPLYYFVDRLANGLVDLRYPQDPEVGRPTAELIAEMQQADLIFLNGAGHEPWAGEVYISYDRVVNTTQAIGPRLIRVREPALSDAEREHTRYAPPWPTWMDLSMAAMQSAAVRDALVKAKPAYRDQIDAQFRSLEQELIALHQDMRALGLRSRNIQVLYAHPGYAYFQKAYGLEGPSISWDHRSLPEEADWEALDSLLDDQPAQWMIWSGEPLPEVVEALESRGLKSVVIPPCAHTPETGDFLSAMRDNQKKLVRVLEASRLQEELADTTANTPGSEPLQLGEEDLPEEEI